MLRAASSITFEPCVPDTGGPPASGPGWIYEIKHDGYRLIAMRDGTGVRSHPERPRLHRALSGGRQRGEPAALPVLRDRRRGRDSRRRRPRDLRPTAAGPRIKPDAILFAFDLLELNGTDMRREPLLTRKAALLALLHGAPPASSTTSTWRATGRDLQPCLRARCEGIVS